MLRMEGFASYLVGIACFGALFYKDGRKKFTVILIKWVVKKVNKGVWGMPGLLEATKDVVSCDKPRGFANRN